RRSGSRAHRLQPSSRLARLRPLVLRDHQVAFVPVDRGPDLRDIPVVHAEGAHTVALEGPMQPPEILAHPVGEHPGLARRIHRAALAAELGSGAGEGGTPVAAWSFYSPDFLASAGDLAWVRARAPGLHVAGGVHATAEPLATLRAGFDLVAVGEGEATAVALASALIHGRNPRELPGVAFLSQGRLASNGPGERR